jgi:hypothetical protein
VSRSRISSIDKALAEHPTDSTLVVFRQLLHGVESLRIVDGTKYNSDTLKIGSIYKDLGYPSTTTNINSGYAHTSTEVMTSDNPTPVSSIPPSVQRVGMRLTVPPNVPAAYLGANSNFPNEHEMLLGRNLTYVVTGITLDDTKTNAMIDAVVVPPNELIPPKNKKKKD